MMAAGTAAQATHDATLPQAATPAPTGDAITVQARTREQTRRLVRSVIDPSRGRYIPTFRESLCVRVQGLHQPYGDILRARIDNAAREAGLRVRTGKCVPNLLVLVPVDVDKAAANLVDLHPMLFGDPAEGMASPRLLATLRRPHAVRWFSSTRVTGRRSGMWRLQSQAEMTKMATYVLLDVTRMNGMDWNSVGDFVAMASLSNARMDAAYPANTTILSLFDDRAAARAAPTRLTSFDRSLLKALYAVDQELTPDLQRQEIIKRVERDAAD
jgi:hypothetical protein